MTVIAQLQVVAVLVSTGIAMGIIFDGYQSFTTIFQVNKYWVAVLDVLYWIAVAIVILILCFYDYVEPMRVYTFIMLLTGIVFYHFILSRHVVAIDNRIFRSFRRFRKKEA